MNPIPSLIPRSRPRLACRVVRAWCALFNPAEPRHVASCADCREFFRAADALDAALRRDAGQRSSVTMTADSGLERRILRAVKNATPAVPAQATSPRRGWSGTWTAGAAAAAVAIMIIFFNRGAETEQTPASTDPVSSADVAIIVDVVQSLSTQVVDSVIPSAGALVANNPLQQELDSVYSDMRSALDFLALNFLPAPQASASPRRDRTI